MSPTSFAGKKVVILGLARQGLALTRFFCQQGAHVTVSDIAPADRLAEPLAELASFQDTASRTFVPARMVLGGHPLSLLDDCDLLCLSGGVSPQIPLVEAARRQGIPLSNDTILTIERSPAPAIGITGSSGKTTTTTLTSLMLQAAGWQAAPAGQDRLPETKPGRSVVWVGGNIGAPLIDRLQRIAAHDWLVLELSSFQLELFDKAAGGRSLSPRIATVLNITPNHLDRHPSMAHYTACKANIVRWQGSAPDAATVLGADDAVTGQWLRSGRVRIAAGAGQPALDFPLAARRLGFGLGEPVDEGCWLRAGQLVLRLDGRERTIMPAPEIRLRGQHNVLNVMAACATVAATNGGEPEAMADVARAFSGVAHRLELVRERQGVRWVNDSIATTPERASAALRSFDEPIVLLAGGRDKKLPWQEFAQLAQQRLRRLIVFGEAADLIADAVLRAGPLPLTRCRTLAEAVAQAAQVAQPGDVVLLSPGGASFDAYKDFEARGRHFRELVAALDLTPGE